MAARWISAMVVLNHDLRTQARPSNAKEAIGFGRERRTAEDTRSD